MIKKVRNRVGLARLAVAPAAVLAAFLMASGAAAATSWTSQQLPAAIDPAHLDGMSVSCPTASVCMAVGTFNQDYNGSFSALWNGTSWTAKPVPSALHATLVSVSCPAATYCIAVGYNSATSQPLAYRWQGASWSALKVPLLTGDTQGELNGVSCTSRTNCVAVGNLYTELWNGTSWTPLAVPGGGSPDLEGVSCPSATFCTAVGDFDATPVAYSFDGTGWTAQTVPFTAEYGYLAGVSCSSASSCFAVGVFSASRGMRALIYRWNGTGWTQQVNTGLTTASSALSGVSCSATACTAAGILASQVAVDHWNGRTWAAATNLVVPPGDSELYGMSCHTQISCVTVGVGGGGPLVEQES